MAPRLSVVMAVGACRDRAQYALDRLCAQTPIDALEIVVVDVAAGDVANHSTLSDAPVAIVSARGLEHWGKARRLGLERTSAPIVAFIEEHCFTEPGWAAALLEAHEGPWASVGGRWLRNAEVQLKRREPDVKRVPIA